MKTRSLMYTTAKRFGMYVEVCLDDVWQYSEDELNAATCNVLWNDKDFKRVGEYCTIDYHAEGWW